MKTSESFLSYTTTIKYRGGESGGESTMVLALRSRNLLFYIGKMVGARGFEPPTPTTPLW